MTSSICSAFWKHTNLRAGNRIFPCCRFKTPIIEFDGDLGQVLQHARYQELRSQAVAGIPIDGCQKCYHEEANGKLSLRQQFNQQYDQDTVSLEYLEVGFDNVCNLTCDGCGPEFSHSWSLKLRPDIDPKFHIETTATINSVPDSIRKVVFLGGEPLMTNQHRRFLDQVDDLARVEIVYNTNGSFLLDDATIRLLNQAKQVHFIVSVDAAGENNSKVRSGSDWSTVLEFVSQIKSLQFAFGIHSVIHANNWKYLHELSQWIHTNNYTWSVNVLTYPAHLDIARQPKDIKQKIRDVVASCQLPNQQYLLNHLK